MSDNDWNDWYGREEWEDREAEIADDLAETFAEMAAEMHAAANELRRLAERATEAAAWEERRAEDVRAAARRRHAAWVCFDDGDACAKCTNDDDDCCCDDGCCGACKPELARLAKHEIRRDRWRAAALATEAAGLLWAAEARLNEP